MLIHIKQVNDWKDLQVKVRDFFREMGYQAEESVQVELAGGGKKEIDVHVIDSQASNNQIYLIECKNWDTNVSQEIVHSFKFVMELAGANTGYIVSKKGFQSGAFEAARFTNIQLLTFEELQHMYGNEWFRKKSIELEVYLDKLRSIYRLHFEQFSPIPIYNNMYYNTPELHQRLYFFNRWVGDLMLTIAHGKPQNYMGPLPIETACNPNDPLSDEKGMYEFKSVREYFEVVGEAAKRCVDEFEALKKEATDRFNGLDDLDQDDMHRKTLKTIREELPVRVLKEKLGGNEYDNILQHLA